MNPCCCFGPQKGLVFHKAMTNGELTHKQGVRKVRGDLVHPHFAIHPWGTLYAFWPILNTHTKTTHFQPSTRITQPIQPKKKHILSYPSSFFTPSQLHPYAHSITTFRTTYHLTSPQQIPPEKSKLHTNKFQLPICIPQNLNIVSCNPTCDSHPCSTNGTSLKTTLCSLPEKWLTNRKNNIPRANSNHVNNPSKIHLEYCFLFVIGLYICSKG